MKLPYFDIHIVKGRNVVDDGQLKEQTEHEKEQEYKDKLRNKMVEKLLDKIEHLKGLLNPK